MNNEIVAYTIGVIGFEKSDQHVLRRAVDMSESRRPMFKPFEKERGGCPHLVLVNADSPSAIESWNRFRRAYAHRGCFSPIFVGCNPADLPCPDPYVLRRPILPTRLFATLDRAVAEVHGYKPNTETAPESGLEDSMQAEAQRGVALDERVALVVDDSLPTRVRMRGVLSSLVSRVDFAETGKRALQLIDAHAYSIIFLDVTLPDEDAYEVCGRIRKHPLQERATVVMLTRNASSADRVMSILAGFDHCLVKPIQPEAVGKLAVELTRPPAAI
jgi:CheY-like chemotaxis protein